MTDGRWKGLVPLALVLAISLTGCAQETRMSSIAELVGSGGPIHGQIKVAGSIANQPTVLTEETLSFRLASEQDETDSVPVRFRLPSDYRLPEGDLRGRVIVVTGEFDGDTLVADDMIFKTSGPYYVDPEPP